MVDPAESATNTVADAEKGASVVVNDKVPADKVNLRFLLVSGKRTDLLFDANETVDGVKTKIFEAWPREWSEEAPESPQHLRVLHQGRFLETTNTLSSYKFEAGHTTVVHLLIKAGPEVAAADEKGKPAVEQVARACRCCTLL